MAPAIPDILENAPPAAIFLGDFNTGKSLLINALVRRPLLFIGRQESLVPPVLISRAGGKESSYCARSMIDGELVSKSHAQFLTLRQINGKPCEYDLLAALIPDMPFIKLLVVDTPGASSEVNKPAIFPDVDSLRNTLFIITTTLEYWPARHTMALISEYHARFPGHFVVAANMADLVNANEIRRVCEKAGRRMEKYGIHPAPPFFALSARLECARQGFDNEYRTRVKRDVRELCDAAFDAFRLALYEFEARAAQVENPYRIDALMTGMFAGSLTNNEKGRSV